MHSLHFILESLFFVSGIALAIIAGVGLRQLTLAKDIARTGAQRDSLKLAADQAAHYMHNIIPMVNVLYEAIEKQHVAFFGKSKAEVNGDQVKVTSTATPADVDALKSIGKEFLAPFNAIDAFAVFFVSGVADEQLGFSAVGTSYCHTVNRYLPLIMLLHRGGFDNLLKLFFLWNSRIESLRLQMERNEIDKNLQKIQNKFIRPIGT